MRNNSIRLRLSQREVAVFAETGTVQETIEFGLTPEKCLVYALEKAEVETVGAYFENGQITVFIPKAEADNWTNTNQIGIEGAQEIGDGKMLKILIEKDFACVTKRDGEDDSDAFPHPEQEAAC